MFFFFFFKQKTAYEMRISDWSSDVCSSDLCRDDRLILLDRVRREIEAESILLARHPLGERPRLGGGQLQCRGDRYVAAEQAALPRRTFVRSEEHTSELQSLMRISYAVFCLKKKNI